MFYNNLLFTLIYYILFYIIFLLSLRSNTIMIRSRKIIFGIIVLIYIIIIIIIEIYQFNFIFIIALFWSTWILNLSFIIHVLIIPWIYNYFLSKKKDYICFIISRFSFIFSLSFLIYLKEHLNIFCMNIVFLLFMFNEDKRFAAYLQLAFCFIWNIVVSLIYYFSWVVNLYYCFVLGINKNLYLSETKYIDNTWKKDFFREGFLLNIVNKITLSLRYRLKHIYDMPYPKSMVLDIYIYLFDCKPWLWDDYYAESFDRYVKKNIPILQNIFLFMNFQDKAVELTLYSLYFYSSSNKWHTEEEINKRIKGNCLTLGQDYETIKELVYRDLEKAKERV